MNGLFYIHTVGEFHWDLSPDNSTVHFPSILHIQTCLLVLFKDGYWNLADFGLATEATSHRLITTLDQSGKNAYRASTILGGDKGVFSNNKSDISSFGCIAFEISDGITVGIARWYILR